jgi:DNA-binding NtrC family response regulator
LSHVIEQAYVLESAPVLPNTTSGGRSVGTLPFYNFARLRDEAVRQALTATRGHKGRAARLLGVHPNTLTRLIAQRDPSDGATVDAGLRA